jgi:hypothetical protein
MRAISFSNVDLNSYFFCKKNLQYSIKSAATWGFVGGLEDAR